MIRISVFYPNVEGKSFDHDYYRDFHGPLAERLMAPLGLVKFEIDRGITAGPTGGPGPFVAIGHLIFNSLEEAEKAWKAHAQELIDDIPNYTRIRPQLQFCRIEA